MSEHETKYLMARKTIINTGEVRLKVRATYGPRALRRQQTRSMMRRQKETITITSTIGTMASGGNIKGERDE